MGRSMSQHAPVAQWIEHLASNQGVGGSNPSGRANSNRTKIAYFVAVNE